MVKVLSILLSLLPAMVMAQVVEVNVSVLSGESSNERVGVVIKKDAETEEFYNLVVELKNHSDKVGATKNQADRKKSEAETGTVSDVLNDALAQLDDLKKKGLLSEADYQKMKAQMSAQVSADMKKDAAAQA
ncbi:MAG: SHOCT domain-containing protein, partial [Muribaculaceae bacterium]|nr:SHOCT domain-containing protein [Muribaculaceae bacterium]